MGFGGGGDGSIGVTNHVHDNSVGEGGELKQDQTLLNGSNLYSRIIIGA